MATFNKFNTFVADIANGVHNLGSDALQLYPSNSLPDAASHTVKADIPEIATGGGYTGPVTVNITSSSQSAGTYSLVGDDVLLITATGAVATFQYIILFNSTASGDPLIGWYARPSPVSMISGDTFTVDFGATIITLT